MSAVAQEAPLSGLALNEGLALLVSARRADMALQADPEYRGAISWWAPDTLPMPGISVRARERERKRFARKYGPGCIRGQVATWGLLIGAGCTVGVVSWPPEATLLLEHLLVGNQGKVLKLTVELGRALREAAK